jgi:ligand-binding sensor domain-containing protein/signal transduction histidine kinase
MRKDIAKGVVWLVVVGIAAVTAGASGGSRSVEATQDNYTTRLWQTQNGLPEETVQAFAQTPDGFLWIGTTSGLLRFDGSRFVGFDRGNTPAFLENSVFTLLTGRNGTLWIGTEGGGLLRLRNGNFRRFGAPDGLLDGFVRTVLEDTSGKIWIGTDDGLFVLESETGERVTRVDGTTNIPTIAVHSLAQTRDGRVWVGGSRLVAFQGDLARDYPLIGEFSETRVKSILQTRDGTVWVGTVSGLQRQLPGKSAFERLPGLQGTVRTLCETGNATLWIGMIGQGAYRLRGGRLEAIDSGSAGGMGLPSKTVLSIFEDAEKNVWMGTQAGMLRFSRSPVGLISLPDAADSDFETVSVDRDGTLWVAGTGLTHVVTGVDTPANFRELHGARVRNVFRSGDGALWIGTDGRGLFRLKSGEPPQQYTTANGLVNNFVRGVLQGRNGDLWIATDEGVSRFSNGTLRNFTVQDGLAYFSVRALLEDRSGGLWIGTDRGLSHLVGDTFQKDGATIALATEKVWALKQSGSGAVWFGTRDDGLYRFMPGESATTHFTTEQGLVSNSIYSILEDPRGRFWMSGAKGVEVVSTRDLEMPGHSSPQHLSQNFFSISEGAELSPLYGGTQPAGVMTADGNAWFPTSKGPVHFATSETVSTDVPQVFIDQVLADGRGMGEQGKPIMLPANNQELEIAYGAILLGSQESVQYQYRLEPFDHDWRYGSNQRVAAYTNLPAGRYSFHVRAFEGGSENVTERTLTIVKRQYFFFTWWFLGGCIAVLALCVWWLHELRLKRAQTAFHAVLEERARLAREMHDTLIQGCAGVSLLLEACSVEAADQTGQSELLDYARTQLAASIDEARQAVWNLREQDSADFGEILTKLTERLDRSSHIEVGCEIDGDSYKFNSLATHEIAMAGREAIYNALLHANPTRIDVRAAFGSDEFALTVKDNGSGFEATTDAPKGHYGLVGIHERITRMGGRVTVTTAIASGTVVVIQIPKAKISFDNSLAGNTAAGKLPEGLSWQK